ncbi:hypothetical protein SAY87_020643 [Trapa incisa]|uniref:Uncharacterized protein n=1 Tax=Trapa incisa TaxID=236973 RepID=A0AAN7JQ42_9MYRT|nr:hypothetical protein SAY87_020643 [Trapa incisa]
MESPSSDLQGAEEELSSSESGWTMYIESPLEEYDDDGGEDESPEVSWARAESKLVGRDNSKEESDDSMASDASSGTSLLHHHHLQNKNIKKPKEDKRTFFKKQDGKDKKKGRGRAPKE